jgi:hypothetical protein
MDRFSSKEIKKIKQVVKRHQSLNNTVDFNTKQETNLFKEIRKKLKVSRLYEDEKLAILQSVKCRMKRSCRKYSLSSLKSTYRKCQKISAPRKITNVNDMCKLIHKSSNIGYYTKFSKKSYRKIQKSPEPRGVINIFKSLRKPNMDIPAYEYGSNIVSGLSAFVYLIAKHKKNACIMTGKDIGEKLYTPISWKCGDEPGDVGDLYFPQRVFDYIRNCKSRFVVIFMRLVPCPQAESLHSNVLIYDSKLKEMERYDPQGINVDWYDTDSLDEQLVQELYPEDI